MTRPKQPATKADKTRVNQKPDTTRRQITDSKVLKRPGDNIPQDGKIHLVRKGGGGPETVYKMDKQRKKK